MPFGVDEDFEAIALWIATLTNPGLGVSTLRGFVDYAKARPGELNVGSAGLGTLHHVEQS